MFNCPYGDFSFLILHFWKESQMSVFCNRRSQNGTFCLFFQCWNVFKTDGFVDSQEPDQEIKLEWTLNNEHSAFHMKRLARVFNVERKCGPFRPKFSWDVFCGLIFEVFLDSDVGGPFLTSGGCESHMHSGVIIPAPNQASTWLLNTTAPVDAPSHVAWA